MVLNTWEAVYFDHRLDRLTALADTAAELGVERFVLDDGWFRHRRDDTAGLGDWYVDEDVWPHGLHPLIDHVRGRGMEFGLWVEPEMVNPDSDLARAHPDWVLPGPPWRHQQALDITIPEAYAYILERLDALLSEYDIAFLKWDHNRDLVTPTHEQTLATYRLLDELRARHPGVEIESCSSGGARVDLGILARTDRVWASDTNDALERQNIQRWTQLLLPPELVGSHVGPPRAHTTGRTHDLSFRAATALFGHFGIEWDIASASDEERTELAEWIARYKRVARAAAQRRGRARRSAGSRLRPARRRRRRPVAGAVLLRGARHLGERAAGRRAPARARPRAPLRGERADAVGPRVDDGRPADAPARPRAGGAHRSSFPGFMIPAGSQRSLSARSTPIPSSPTSAPIHGA